ncbi:MAG: YceI family protein [Betaproteobacteria bacterium]|nr:YceI family protein [Betaproteobacteria bacterium]
MLINHRFLLATLMAFALCGHSASHAQQKLQPAQSEIVFVSKQMGVPVEGRFKSFDAQISFDPAKPANGKISFSVDMASATLGAKETDAELQKPDWFSTAKFAKAGFQSTTIKQMAAGKYEVSGKLSIKGLSQDIAVPVSLTQTGGLTTAVGSFALKRLGFKIGDNEWSDTSMVADEVQVKFKFVLTGVAKL